MENKYTEVNTARDKNYAQLGEIISSILFKNGKITPEELAALPALLETYDNYLTSKGFINQRTKFSSHQLSK